MADEFEDIQVGDTVALHTPVGWSRKKITKHVVTRKTATQITLDNGKRFTRRLTELGMGDRWHRAPRIEKWTDETDKTLALLAERTRQEKALRRLQETSWEDLTTEQRDQACALLDTWQAAEQKKA